MHRARLKSGQEVAVKIQYPGIARTIRTDFRNLIPLLLPARLTSDWENLKEQVNFVRRGIEQETDYARAAFRKATVALLLNDEAALFSFASAASIFFSSASSSSVANEYSCQCLITPV